MTGALELSNIYEIVAQAFGKASDFVLDEEHVTIIYEKMQRGEELDAEFEGRIV